MVWHGRLLRVLCLCLLVAFSAQATAQEDGPFADYFAAADQLDRLAGAASAAGAPPPRLSDPQVAALFARMADGPRVFNRVHRQEDVPATLQVLNRTLGFLRLYAAWGTPNGLSPEAQGNFHDRNAVTYQNEIIPIMGFEVDGMSRLLRIMAASVSTLPPDERRGSAEGRNGLIELLGGMIGLIQQRGITPDHQLSIARILDRNATDLAGALTLSQRLSMASQFDAMRERVPPQTRAEIDHLLRAFQAQDCTGLCAI